MRWCSAVVAAVRGEIRDVRIACTQLSRNCPATVPIADPRHLVDLPRGVEGRRCCCAGTLRFSLDAGDPVDQPAVAGHRAFIDEHADTALCI